MDRMSPTNNYNGLGSTGYGAWEIGARFSKFDADDFVSGTDISATGSTSKVDSYTVGIKWIPEPNTRFLLDYVYTDFGREIMGTTGSSGTALVLNRAYSDENAINMRAQFDF